MTTTLAFAAALLSAQPPPTWRLVEELRVGSVDGPAALAEVLSLAVDGAGTIHVAQWNVPEIAVFGADGSVRPSIGRQGAGPGEFMGIGRLGFRGDTLWAADPMQGRISLFLAGAYAGQRAIPATGRPLLPIAPLPDSSILAEVGVPMLAVVDYGVTVVPIVRLAPGAPFRFDTIAVRAAARAVRVPYEGSPNFIMLDPFRDGGLYDVALDGRTLVVVDRESRDDELRIAWIGTTAGDTLSHAVLRYTPQRMTRETADRRLAGRGDMEPALRRALREAITIPTTVAGATAVFAAADLTVWLRREDAPVTAEWSVLDRSGRVRATVRLPAAARVHHATAAHVWAAGTDDDGVPWIVRYRIEPR